MASLGIILSCLLMSYNWSSYKLTKDRLQQCNKVIELLIKHYDKLPKEKGRLESIVLTRYLINKLDTITNIEDRKTLVEFINSKEIESVLFREGKCVRIAFRRKNPFLFNWKGYYLIFHIQNQSKYETNEEDPTTCRLMPCSLKLGNNCTGQEFVIDVKTIDAHRVFVTTKGRIGAPS